MWSFNLAESPLPILGTAIHAGHELRPEVAAKIALDDAARRREEDPFTDRVAGASGPPVVVHRSRFEVDLNRPRASAVYRTPEDAWGLAVWAEAPDDGLVARSLREYDAFYEAMARILDELAARGPFVVLDVHSYNHRRAGACKRPAPAVANPEVNVGTGSVDRDWWGPLVDRFEGELRQREVRGHRLDVRENVRFKGGHFSQWVNERYGRTGCALAVELKKVFMDEWTGELDDEHLEELVAAFAGVAPALADALPCAVR